jgi:hypothetical protein
MPQSAGFSVILRDRAMGQTLSDCVRELEPSAQPGQRLAARAMAAILSAKFTWLSSSGR